MRALLSALMVVLALTPVSAAESNEDRYLECVAGKAIVQRSVGASVEAAMAAADKACKPISDKIEASQDSVEGDVGDAIEWRRGVVVQILEATKDLPL
jgi:hypothetical protein